MAAPLRDNIPVEGPVGAGHYLIGNFDNNRTNAQVTLAAKATEYLPGTVLGKITATGIYTPLNPAANDGSQNAVAICFSRRGASAATQRGAATVREATLNLNSLIYDIAVTGPQKAAAEAALAALGMVGGY